MDNLTKDRFLADLAERREAIVEAWHQAIAATGYVPLSTPEIKSRLAGLVDLAGEVFLSEPFQRERAQQIGSRLAAMHYLHPTVPGWTVDILGCELTAGLPPGEPAWVQARLADLLGAIVTGYFQQANFLILAEQEQVRSALVAELRAKERSLRQARDELEIRVRERTAELARSNEHLRAEIDRRLQVEDALRASERRYRAVVEDQTELISRYRPDGTITFVNEAYCRFFQRSRQSLVGQRFQRWMSDQDLVDFNQVLAALTPQEPVVSIERRPTFFQPYGRWLEWTIRGIFDDDGSLVEVQSVARDVTERRRAKEALRESEARWRSLVQNAPDIVATVDRRGDILYLNRLPERSNATVDDVVGTPATHYTLPEYGDIVSGAIQSAFEQGEQSYYEVPGGVPGNLDWVAVRVGPIYEGGQITKAMLVVRDISARKKLEQMKDNLIHDVSHELRTPLAKIKMSLELIQERVFDQDADPARTQRMAELAVRNVDHMLQMVEGILDLSRLEVESSRLQREKFSVAELVFEAVGYMHSLAQLKDLYLEFEIEDGLPPVWGDRDKLFRVLINLVDNAIKFTTRGGVTISAHARNGEVLIAVSDTGQGIAPDNLENVFERFFQEKSHSAGVGIGLTLCRAIVEIHDGHIWASSPGEGQGTTFQFVLPAGEEEA
ncbi:MAG: PAS domain S-box protein [Anaerolineae bacterium]|jgi:PAS domain S-box-containing protein